MITYKGMGVSDTAQVGDDYEIESRRDDGTWEKKAGRITKLYPYYPDAGDMCIYHSTKVILADVTVV